MSLSPGHTPQDIQNHLYRAFLDRATTDVSVNVRAKGWNVTYDLHRVVLIQSGFFRSLFTRGFKEQSRRPASPFSDHGDAIDVQFDDPNITRAAFEICIARLYGGGPALHVSPSLTPTTAQPLTPYNLQPPPYHAPPVGKHPATPRFLLSLIATSIYLSIPQVTSYALSLVLATIGPSTLIRYLNFSLGNGIGDIGPGDLPSVVGLEHVGRELPAFETSDDRSTSVPDTDSSAEGNDQDDIASRKHGGSGNREQPAASSASVAPGSESVYDEPSGLVFNYGILGNKIGEAAACWLARWAVDILPYEEDWHYSQQVKASSGGTGARVQALRDPNHSRASSHPPRPMTMTPGVSSPLTPTSSSRRATISTPTINRQDAHQGLGRHLLPPNTRPPTIWSRNGGLSAKWVRGLLSSDDLFMRGGEKERYDLAVRVVELRRRELRAIYSVEEGVADDQQNMASEIEEEEKEWTELFGRGLYYSHMSLEDLLRVQNDISPTARKHYVPLSILKFAHWSQSLFRAQLMSRPSVGSSGSPRASTSHSPESKDDDPWKDSFGSTTTYGAIANSLSASRGSFLDPESASKTYFPVLPNGSQKFGGDVSKDTVDALALEASGGEPSGRRETKRPGVVRGRQLSADNFFGLMVNGRKSADDIVLEGDDENARWTENEPCRFSVEFWGVESLKQSNRLYSNTVWCMGSLWNVYVQIVRKKGLQLGVYLQRQSFVDPVPPHSVPPILTPRQDPSLHASSSVPSFVGSVERPSTPVATQSAISPRSRPWAIPGHSQSTTGFPLFRSPTPVGSPPPQYAFVGGTSPLPSPTLPAPPATGSQPITAASSVPHSPYRDPRGSISAYFSIHCPSATGTSATKFSSEPDTFSVTQSWGWKSSKAEEWVDFDTIDDDNAIGSASRSRTGNGSSGLPRMECSLRATIVLGVV